jgi:hypothetical protein
MFEKKILREKLREKFRPGMFIYYNARKNIKIFFQYKMHSPAKTANSQCCNNPQVRQFQVLEFFIDAEIIVAVKAIL